MVRKASRREFVQRRRDGKGDWIWNMDGIERVPYRLPDLLNASEVYIVEGEKDCNNLAELGLTATTNPGGAGKWQGHLRDGSTDATPLFFLTTMTQAGSTPRKSPARSRALRRA